MLHNSAILSADKSCFSQAQILLTQASASRSRSSGGMAQCLEVVVGQDADQKRATIEGAAPNIAC
ncbi:hypothetical protein ACVOMV_26875 (plasmid) [Mesorhizobium atlanticum]